MESIHEKFKVAVLRLENEENLDVKNTFRLSKEEYESLLKNQYEIKKKDINKILLYYPSLTKNDFYSNEIGVNTINEATICKIFNKLNYLNNYLKENKCIDLCRAISTSETKMNSYLTGVKFPSKRTTTIIAHYFLLEYVDLINDEVELPKYDNLKVDEDLYKIQKDDEDMRNNAFKNKHFLSRNYRALSLKKRIKLILSLALISIPLFAFTSYCMYSVTADKNDIIQKYKEGSEDTLYDTHDKTQVDLYNELKTTSKEEKEDAYYANVTVGTTLYRIHDISAEKSSYSTKMELYFKFDKEEFRTMFKNYAKEALLEQIISDWEKDTGNTFTSDFNQWLNTNQNFFDEWVTTNDKNYYPGENSSNIYVDNQSMFTIGNGSIEADTFSFEKELEEIEDPVTKKTTCYQRVSFEADFNKSFDSPRYPLESVQFKMYIQPTMDANYIRYTPDYSTNSNGESLSGFSPYFSITNGYRLIKEKDDIKNMSMRINYYKDVNNDPSLSAYPNTIKTQLEIVVRANRQGISLFLKAFMNLFAVIIWIIIAFYNQSYNGQDSIGMLGTGLFGVISSMLVGLSMMSDAGIFSMITMINIFTLAVIMVMTYHSVVQIRANTRKDLITISYNNVKLRILFIVISITTILMFIGLPLMSYLFGL